MEFALVKSLFASSKQFVDVESASAIANKNECRLMVISLGPLTDERVNGVLDVGGMPWSKLQSFHCTMNKLRKEKAVFVAMLAAENESPLRRRVLSECYSFVMCTFLVKRRGLDPRQAAALLLKRSGKLCDVLEETIVYCEKWKDLTYPDEAALALPNSLLLPPPVVVHAVPEPVAASTAEEGSNARSPRAAENGMQRRTTLRKSGHLGTDDGDSLKGEVPRKSVLVPSTSPRQARVSMNEFVGSVPAGGDGSAAGSGVQSENNSSAGSLKGSDERKKEPDLKGSGEQKKDPTLKDSGERLMKSSGDSKLPVEKDGSSAESRGLSQSIDEVPNPAKMAVAQPPIRSSAPARSLSISMPDGQPVEVPVKDTLRVKDDKRSISASGNIPSTEKTSPRASAASNDLSGSGSLRKTPVRVTSGNFLSRLGAKLVGKKGPKTELPSTEDEESSTLSGSLPVVRKDEAPHRSPSPQPDAKEHRKERLPDEQDKRVDSSGPSKKREIVDIVVLSDLSSDDQKLVSEAALDSSDCEQHLFILLNVLHFHTKKVYRLRDVKTGEIRITSSDREDDTFDYAKAEIELLSREDPSKSYKLGSEVGKGGFGSVYECIPLKNKKQLVACKVLPHTRSKDKKYNLQEVLFLKTYPHPNVVQFHQAFKVNTKNGCDLWMIMELMRGGTLTEAVKAHNFKENEIAYVCQEMLFGIRHLHRHNIAHRDLKSANVMLTVDGQVKLIDFGLCCDMSQGEQGHMVGSPFWIPPEMIRRETHGLAVDVWSFGICTLELANNNIPNRHNSIYAMFTNTVKGFPKPFVHSSNFSTLFHEFIQGALNVDPKKRLSSKELRDHQWIQTTAASAKSMQKVISKIFTNHALDDLF